MLHGTSRILSSTEILLIIWPYPKLAYLLGLDMKSTSLHFVLFFLIWLHKETLLWPSMLPQVYILLCSISYSIFSHLVLHSSFSKSLSMSSKKLSKGMSKPWEACSYDWAWLWCVWRAFGATSKGYPNTKWWCGWRQ